MRGHIVKRGKNSYSIVLSLGYDPVTGKRLRQWHSIKGNKKEAEQKLSELLRQLDTGTFVKPGNTTIGEFMERWLTEYVRPSVAPRTAEGYEHIARRHLIPSLGSIRLVGLKPEHLQRYYADKLASGRCDGKGALSAKTVRHHHVTIHDALKCAVKWGLLARNPADAVDPPKPQAHEMHTLDEEKLRTFLEASRSTPYYPLFYLALFTGMRRSEMLALQWQDVDFIRGEVSVNRSLHHLRDGTIVFRQPKTAKGRRLIALTPSAAVILMEHREKCEAIRKALSTPLGDSDLVFSHADGKPWLPDTITHAWAKVARRIGVPGIRLHDARHTHASLMLKQGVHPKIVQERLGHASIQLTLDTYSHVTPGLQAAAAAGFDAGLGLKPPVEAERHSV